MGLLTPERLIDDARSGVKLTTDDRRSTLRYLRFTQPELTNVDMAELFQVTEGTVRNDLKLLRQEQADELSEDDVTLVISDLIMVYRRQIRDLEKSKAKCVLGTFEYRSHCNSILDIELRKTDMLQKLGYLPKSLGNLTVTKFEYAAIVGKGDQIDTRPVSMFDDPTQAQIRLKAQKVLEAGNPTLPIIDAETEETSLLVPTAMPERKEANAGVPEMPLR